VEPRKEEELTENRSWET